MRDIVKFRDEYRFLSNFWYAAVEFDGKWYSTTEHAYQAAKTLDRSLRREIQYLDTPKEAKDFGSTVELREDWDIAKLVVMWDVLNQKFRIPEFKEKLLGTEDSLIFEGNDWHDVFWGCCTCDKHRGAGENNLGRMLLQIRTDLQNGNFETEWKYWDETDYFHIPLSLKESTPSLFELFDE